MEQQLEYINKGRGGYVIYKSGKTELRFEFEFGGGNCIAIIYIPAISNWESETNLPLSDRERTLTFIAEQSIKDQAPNSNYILSDDCIEIMQPSR